MGNLSSTPNTNCQETFPDTWALRLSRCVQYGDGEVSDQAGMLGGPNACGSWSPGDGTH